MVTLFKSLVLGAVLTWIISAVSNTSEIWYYFVPISLSILVLLLLYAQTIDKAYARSIIAKSPELFNSTEKEIFQYTASVFVPIFRPMSEPQRLDKASAVGLMQWITIGYCIYAGIQGEWLVVLLTVLPILYVYFGSVLFCCFYSGDKQKDSEAIFIIVQKSKRHFLVVDRMLAEDYLETIAQKLRFPKPTDV